MVEKKPKASVWGILYLKFHKNLNVLSDYTTKLKVAFAKLHKNGPEKSPLL